MRKILVFSFIYSLLFCQSSFAADTKVRQFHGSGEVLSVDPVYSQISIEHAAIKDFSTGNDSEFFVSSPDLLKGIAKGDLVEFDGTDNKGDVKIEKINKTGVAPAKSESAPLGEAMSSVLQGTGSMVRGVTEVIPPVHEVAKSVTTATDATGDALKDSGPESKSKF